MSGANGVTQQKAESALIFTAFYTALMVVDYFFPATSSSSLCSYSGPGQVSTPKNIMLHSQCQKLQPATTTTTSTNHRAHFEHYTPSSTSHSATSQSSCPSPSGHSQGLSSENSHRSAASCGRDRLELGCEPGSRQGSL